MICGTHERLILSISEFWFFTSPELKLQTLVNSLMWALVLTKVRSSTGAVLALNYWNIPPDPSFFKKRGEDQWMALRLRTLNVLKEDQSWIAVIPIWLTPSVTPVPWDSRSFSGFCRDQTQTQCTVIQAGKKKFIYLNINKKINLLKSSWTDVSVAKSTLFFQGTQFPLCPHQTAHNCIYLQI